MWKDWCLKQKSVTENNGKNITYLGRKKLKLTERTKMKTNNESLHIFEQDKKDAKNWKQLRIYKSLPTFYLYFWLKKVAVETNTHITKQ